MFATRIGSRQNVEGNMYTFNKYKKYTKKKKIEKKNWKS